MDLIDFLMPEPAQAMHLREIARAMREQTTGKQRLQRTAGRLENDVGAVALVCMALVAALIEKGVITEQDLKSQLGEIDKLDSFEDGRLDPNLLRGKMGLTQPVAPQPARPKGAIPRPRRRGPG